MKNERKFFKCQHCGNIVSHLQNAGAGVFCCGEMMQEIKPNTTDAAKEKHVPSVIREEAGLSQLSGDVVQKRTIFDTNTEYEVNILTVSVGSVPHPMTEEHHIAWIVAADGARTQRVALTSTQAPSADFFVSDDPVTVYAYCNLHGLWEAQA